MPKKDRSNTIREASSGVTAHVRKSEIAIISPREIDALCAESPPDQDVTVPVAALKAWRQHIRNEQLEQLDVDGRLARSA